MMTIPALPHLSIPAPSSPCPEILSKHDRRVVATLHARLLDEMERLASEEVMTGVVGEVITPPQMQSIAAVCLTGLHYLLVGHATSEEIACWVEDALAWIHRTCQISTRHAQREYLASFPREEVA